MLSYQQLLANVKKINFHESRVDSADFLEFVINRCDLDELTAQLDAYFGPAAKPAGEEALQQHKKLTDPFGGISKNQILYCRTEKDKTECAMIWPWQNSELVTVKIVQYQTQNPELLNKSAWWKVWDRLFGA